MNATASSAKGMPEWKAYLKDSRYPEEGAFVGALWPKTGESPLDAVEKIVALCGGPDAKEHADSIVSDHNSAPVLQARVEALEARNAALAKALAGFLDMAISYGWDELPQCRGTLIGEARAALAQNEEAKP